MESKSQVEDFYGLLGVSDFAELECVREAYKRLALQLHPDKNSSPTATEDFQKLGIAWETLRDPVKRAAYDRSFARSRRKHTRDSSEEDDCTANRSLPDSRTRKQPRKEEKSRETAYQKKIRVFRSSAKKNYLSRLRDWNRFRSEHDPFLIDVQNTMKRQELDLKEQANEDDSDILQNFSAAINGYSSQHNTSTLPKMRDARKKYMEWLSQQLKETRISTAKLFSELEERIRSYEEEERDSMMANIRVALAFAGTRNLHGSNDRAITAWNALSRVKWTLKFPSIMRCVEPWHKVGEWVRETRECNCDRCGQSAYHFIPECGAAKCTSCSMVICDSCYRDIRLLQEYESWLTGSDQAKSLFSLDFDASESIDPGRGPRHDYGIKKVYDDED